MSISDKYEAYRKKLFETKGDKILEGDKVAYLNLRGLTDGAIKATSTFHEGMEDREWEISDVYINRNGQMYLLVDFITAKGVFYSAIQKVIGDYVLTYKIAPYECKSRLIHYVSEQILTEETQFGKNLHTS